MADQNLPKCLEVNLVKLTMQIIWRLRLLVVCLENQRRRCQWSFQGDVGRASGTIALFAG